MATNELSVLQQNGPMQDIRWNQICDSSARITRLRFEQNFKLNKKKFFLTKSTEIAYSLCILHGNFLKNLIKQIGKRTKTFKIESFTMNVIRVLLECTKPKKSVVDIASTHEHQSVGYVFTCCHLKHQLHSLR